MLGLLAWTEGRAVPGPRLLRLPDWQGGRPHQGIDTYRWASCCASLPNFLLLAAGDAGDAVAGDPDNGVHSDSSRSGDNMDLQKALKIVAKHYSRRNVQIITACCRSRSLLFLVFLTSCSRQQHPTMCGVGRGPVRRDRMRERADAHSKRKRSALSVVASSCCTCLHSLCWSDGNHAQAEKREAGRVCRGGR